MRRAIVVACVLASLGLAAACGEEDGDEAPAVSSEALPETSTSPPPVPTTEDLTDAVARTRAAILAAARARDYDALEPLIDSAEIFLSDAGFGEDPVAYWREQGEAPLEAMEALLGMSSTVEETNEGRLYRWPRFTENSNPEEMLPEEREALVALLGEDGLQRSFQDETGYIAPRLGILDDGTWWFLILEPNP